MNAPLHFSALARRSTDPPISWLMRLALERRGLISLAVGFTDDETFPVDEVAVLARRILSDPVQARKALQYGTAPGLAELREEILRRWQQQDGMENVGSGLCAAKNRISSDNIVVTNGSQQLLYLVSEVLCDPGDIVLVEDPTYFVYLGIVEAMGIRTAGFDSIAHLASRIQRLKSHRLLSRLKWFLSYVSSRIPPAGPGPWR